MDSWVGRWQVMRKPVTVVIICGTFFYYFWRIRSWDVAGLDVGIYREAAVRMLAGEDVFSGKYGPPGLPFTYPPFSLIVFLPLALVPEEAAFLIMLGLSAVALVLCVRWCLEYSCGTRFVDWWKALLAASLAALLIEPLKLTLELGQINLVLLGIIMAFDMRGNSRFSGIGAGIGSAIKITPAILIVAQAVRGSVRDAIRGIVAFALCTAFAAIFMPAATWLFFTDLLWNSSRPGNIDYIGNQSLRGLWERLLPAQAQLLWAISVVIVVAVAMYAVRRYRSDKFAALTIAAMCGLLISPISWNHHWVWVLPAVAVSYRYRRQSGTLGVSGLILLVAAIFERPIWAVSASIWPLQEFYVVSGVLWLVVAAAGSGLASDSSARIHR